MTEDDLLALCVLEEAGGEIPDGRAAVARVIKNRTALRFFSDGTLIGTILHYDQFSWAWFEYSNGKYHRVAWTTKQAAAIAEKKLAAAPRQVLDSCRSIAQQVMTGTYSGILYDELTDHVVLYLNKHIIRNIPAWASPENYVCTIGSQDFYKES